MGSGWKDTSSFMARITTHPEKGAYNRFILIYKPKLLQMTRCQTNLYISPNLLSPIPWCCTVHHPFQFHVRLESVAPEARSTSTATYVCYIFVCSCISGFNHGFFKPLSLVSGDYGLHGGHLLLG